MDKFETYLYYNGGTITEYRNLFMTFVMRKWMGNIGLLQAKSQPLHLSHYFYDEGYHLQKDKLLCVCLINHTKDIIKEMTLKHNGRLDRKDKMYLQKFITLELKMFGE